MAGYGDILVLNAGSSSIKFAFFDSELTEKLFGIAADLGGQSFLKIGGKRRGLPLIDHRAALVAALKALTSEGVAVDEMRAAAHRVVHGGRKLTAPVRIGEDVRAEIAACSPLAPLHNPHNLAVIDTLAELVPNLPQFASFDTSFYATNPEVASTMPSPG